ncbi:hypothetical protein CsSME_00036550 [Camellia sinensis var. sinensis]
MGLIGPEKLLLDRDRTRRNCNRKRLLPIWPEREKPWSWSSETRLVLGSHWMPTQLQRLSSFSFHDVSLECGSVRPALKTIKPKTSSLNAGSVECTTRRREAKKRRVNKVSSIIKIPNSNRECLWQ